MVDTGQPRGKKDAAGGAELAGSRMAGEPHLLTLQIGDVPTMERQTRSVTI